MYLNLRRLVRNAVPILKWAQTYRNFDVVVADFVAGITIGLTLIPQVIAYASLAGLGPQYGLYASLCGGVVYGVFGGVPEINIAPTALLSLLTFSYAHGNVHAAIVLCFISGLIELMFGLLHLGFLVDFVSLPVVAAFTSAGAITIASAQVKNLLGLHFEAESFLSVWQNVGAHIEEVKLWDAVLGCVCCFILLLMRKLKDFGTPPLETASDEKTLTFSKNDSNKFKKFIWFCSVGRNAFVVIGCALTAYIFQIYDLAPFSLTSKVPQGLPPVRLPFEGNSTESLLGVVENLGGGVIVLPIIAILSNVAIAKAFSQGKVIDCSQEMIAVGMCNVFGAFLGSYPIAASFSRGAVSNASGVKTPLAGFYTSAMVILALTFLTPYFSYIPKATLSAVIICAVIFMVEAALVRIMWRVNKIDLIPFFITFLCCLLLGIEIGILIGVGVDIVFLLYNAARPGIAIEQISNDGDENVPYTKITPNASVLFPSAEHLRDKILMQAHENSKSKELSSRAIVVDCKNMARLDFTAAKCFSAFVQDLNKLQTNVIFLRPNAKTAKILENCLVEPQRICHTAEQLRSFFKDSCCLTSVSSNNRAIFVKSDRNDGANTTTTL